VKLTQGFRLFAARRARPRSFAKWVGEGHLGILGSAGQPTRLITGGDSSANEALRAEPKNFGRADSTRLGYCMEGTDKRGISARAKGKYWARAGMASVASRGDDKKPLGNQAWGGENGGDQKRPVGGNRHNPWGFTIPASFANGRRDFRKDYPRASASDPGRPFGGIQAREPDSLLEGRARYCPPSPGQRWDFSSVSGRRPKLSNCACGGR
jgi:hypothetical protein